MFIPIGSWDMHKFLRQQKSDFFDFNIIEAAKKLSQIRSGDKYKKGSAFNHLWRYLLIVNAFANTMQTAEYIIIRIFASINSFHQQ